MCMNGKGIRNKKGHSKSSCRWKYVLWVFPSIQPQTEETMWSSLEIFSWNQIGYFRKNSKIQGTICPYSLLTPQLICASCSPESSKMHSDIGNWLTFNHRWQHCSCPSCACPGLRAGASMHSFWQLHSGKQKTAPQQGTETAGVQLPQPLHPASLGWSVASPQIPAACTKSTSHCCLKRLMCMPLYRTFLSSKLSAFGCIAIHIFECTVH